MRRPERTVRLVGVNNGRRRGQHRTGQVMVGDDHRNALRRCVGNALKTADAAVDGDDQVRLLGRRQIDQRRRQAVAHPESVGHHKIYMPGTEHPQPAHRHGHPGGAVTVIVAGHHDALLVADGGRDQGRRLIDATKFGGQQSRQTGVRRLVGTHAAMPVEPVDQWVQAGHGAVFGNPRHPSTQLHQGAMRSSSASTSVAAVRSLVASASAIHPEMSGPLSSASFSHARTTSAGSEPIVPRSAAVRRSTSLASAPLALEGHGDIPAITDWVPDLSPANNYFGIWAPADTPAEVFATMDKVWAETVANSDALKAYAAGRGAFVEPSYGDDAQAATAPMISQNAWLLFDAQKAPNDPEDFGIARP